MRVEYHEALVLTSPTLKSVPTGRVVLDDFHKAAWRIFCGGSSQDAGRVDRPFIFRADEVMPGRAFFRVRCPHPFVGSERKEIALTPGDELDVDFHAVPMVSKGREVGRSRRVCISDSEQWPSIITNRVARHGFEFCGEPTIDRVVHMPTNRSSPRVDVLNIRARVKVVDEHLAALAWLQGVSPKRAYGMGMMVQL